MVSEKIKRIISITAVLSFVACAIVVIIGSSFVKIIDETKILENFLQSSSNLQINFEQSLITYTEKTEETIEFLNKIRPDNEAKYIDFIRDLELIGEALNIDIDLESIKPSSTSEVSTEVKISPTLDYKISFLGSENDLLEFMHELESLPRYIKITNIEFLAPKIFNEQKTKRQFNTIISISLYTK